MFVAAAVPGHADARDREVDGEGLADFVVPAGVAQFLDEDGVGGAEFVGVFLFHFAEDAHAQARAGERVAHEHVAWQAESQAEFADFVLEQFAQRFDEAELHVFRQAADVVVALDDVGLAGGRAGGFDDVRVDGALGEPIDVSEFGGVGVEDFDEGVADDLALGFRVGHAFELGHELVFRVRTDDV